MEISDSLSHYIDCLLMPRCLLQMPVRYRQEIDAWINALPLNEEGRLLPSATPADYKVDTLRFKGVWVMQAQENFLPYQSGMPALSGSTTVTSTMPSAVFLAEFSTDVIDSTRMEEGSVQKEAWVGAREDQYAEFSKWENA